MKTINVTFEDDEYKRLDNIKGNKNWHDFILELLIYNGDMDTW